MRKTHVRPPQGTHGARCGRSKSVISRYCRRDTLPPATYKSVPNWQANCPDFRAFDALAAAADMRITPDLLQRSRKKITPHIPQKKSGRPIFNFPPYFFKVADLRFNTFFDTKRAIRRCWRSLRALRMLPIDSPSNSTLNGMFASHFRKRSLAKIQKIRKNLPGR